MDFTSGFTTGTGKTMAIAAAAMEKARSLFSDLDEDLCKVQKSDSASKLPPAMSFTTSNGLANIRGQSSGFTTGTGKVMAIGSAAMEKARNFFNDLDEKDPTPKLSPNVSFITSNGFESIPHQSAGFKTGTGKGMAIGSAAMEKARALFSDLDEQDPYSPNELKKFNSTPKLLPDVSGSITNSRRLQDNGPVGFTTGTGKNMATGSAAMEKARVFFSDLDKEGALLPNKVQESDSTPKLPPAISRFSNGRRRLANIPNQSSSSEKKQKMNIFDRVEETKSTPNSFNSSPSPLLGNLPQRRSFFRYNTPNGRRKTISPLFSSNSTSGLKNQNEMIDQYSPEDGSSFSNSVRSRTIELGKLYQSKKENMGKRLTLASELAGQLPRSYQLDEYQRYGVKPATLLVTSGNASNFEFTRDYFCDEFTELVLGDGVRLEYDNPVTNVSADDLLRAFLNSSLVETRLISIDWCRNHYRWIVWKEAAMEIAFPHLFGGKLLTPDRVMLQLKYRYDREIEKAERSALKRILNGDDTPFRPMVLCVSAIISKTECDALVELTDDWYAVNARLDLTLSQKLSNGQIFVGQKLFISRCSIVGLDGGCDPLEIPANVQLVLSVNNVRRARWNAGLGYQARSKVPVPCFPLVSLVAGGGTVSGIQVIIRRMYPMMYMVKTACSTMILDEKAEAKEARAFELIYERCLDKMLEEIKKEFMVDGSQVAGEPQQSFRKGNGIKSIPTTQEIRGIRNVEELYRLLISAADPSALVARTTPTQKENLKTFCGKMDDQRAFEMHRKMENAIRSKAGSLPQRKVVPFLKMEVAGLHEKDVAQKATALLTIWRPDDDMFYHIKEGMAYILTGVQVSKPGSPSDSSKLALSTTTETRFIPVVKKNCKE